MNLIIISVTLSLSSCSMKLSIFNNAYVYKTNELVFSQAVVFNVLGNGSKQVGWDKDLKLPEVPTLANQFGQTLKNLESLLQNQVCSWRELLHLGFYVLDINGVKIESISRSLKKNYPNNYALSTSLLALSTLARENL